MKRRDLDRAIKALGKQQGITPVWEHGGNHDTLTFGKKQTSIPRHREINEITAKSILKYLSE